MADDVVLVGVSKGQVPYQSTIVLDPPTGWQENDVFLIVQGCGGNSVMTTPTGYQFLVESVADGGSSNGIRIRVYFRLATANETPLTVGAANAGHGSTYLLTAWRNANRLAPTLLATSNTGGSSSTSASAPTVTTESDNAMIIVFGGGSHTFNASGWTNANLEGFAHVDEQSLTTNYDVRAAIGAGIMRNAGDTGISTWTWSGSQKTAAVTLVLEQYIDPYDALIDKSRAVHYPSFFPCPTWRYSELRSSFQRRTPMESGWKRQRKQWPQFGKAIDLTWVMGTDMFDNWYAFMEANGYDWFYIELDDYGAGRINERVRLSTDIQFTYDDHDVVTATATGEIFREGKILDPDCVPPYFINQPEIVKIPHAPVCGIYECDAYEQVFAPYMTTPQYGMWPLLDPNYGGTIPQYLATTLGGSGGPNLTTIYTGNAWGAGVQQHTLAGNSSDPCGAETLCLGDENSAKNIHFENDSSGIFGTNSVGYSIACVFDGAVNGTIINLTSDGWAWNESGNQTNADHSSSINIDFFFDAIHFNGIGNETVDIPFGSALRGAPYLLIAHVSCSNDRYEVVPGGWSRTPIAWKCDMTMSLEVWRYDGVQTVGYNNTFKDHQIGFSFLQSARFSQRVTTRREC
jgi:hypothetical protein